jgi:uncharacterized protein (DUF1330 family)
MPAYLVVDSQVTDPAKYEGYKKLSPAAIAKYGGRFLVRGGEMVVLEGDWKPNRVVVVEFPSLARAQEFYRSPEYTKAREARKGAAIMKMVAVEGL